jgi:hypothetical protein
MLRAHVDDHLIESQTLHIAALAGDSRRLGTIESKLRSGVWH